MKIFGEKLFLTKNIDIKNPLIPLNPFFEEQRVLTFIFFFMFYNLITIKNGRKLSKNSLRLFENR